MAIHRALRALMTETVTIAPRGTLDVYKQETPGTAVSYAAYVMGKVTKITDASGAERISTVTVILSSAPGVLVTDTLTLPSHWPMRTPKILNVAKHCDETGQYYETVYCG